MLAKYGVFRPCFAGNDRLAETIEEGETFL